MQLPYGSWPSPISAASLVQGVVGIAEVVVDGEAIWWSESRPSEGGRVAIMRRDPSGAVAEVSPPDANVRTQVHEYGGGAWWVCNGKLYYTEMSDQRLRSLVPGDEPVLLSPEPDTPRGMRFADGRESVDGNWFVCVREHHHTPGIEPANEIVAVATDGSLELRVLVAGSDFYSSPRPSPDGTLLAWVQWEHPDMPWFGSTLWIGELEDGSVVRGRALAGGRDESVQQPEWSADSDLYFLSDRSGRSNLYKVTEGEPEIQVGGEFDIGSPQWVFGASNYAVAPDGSLAVSMTRPAGDMLLVDSTDQVHSGWNRVSSVRVTESGVPVFIGASHGLSPAVISHDGEDEYVNTPIPHGVPADFLTPPEAITFPTSGGAEAHALYYPPAHPDAVGPDGEKPPLLVLAHGGPTGSARRELQLALRYWTSRGWAVVDVDYRGSFGYGRQYMLALDTQWGVADVDDCIAAAQYLVARGDVDADRLAIKGGSAGGFTVLAALTFHDVFAAGASRYGIADLSALLVDDHKFESKYTLRLVGDYPAERARYEERSPVHHMERLSAPMIVLQGGQDKVVPPSQAEMMVAALSDKNVPHAYLLFENEGHGFRSGENIVAALEGEYSFFAQIFGFDPADDIAPIAITPPPNQRV